MRFPAGEVLVGTMGIGGSNPVRLQSMTNTPTADVSATTAQAIRIIEAGADLVRVAVPDKKSLMGLAAIRKKLSAAGFKNPLIADIHFLPELALLAAPLVEKLRINPGNYTDRNRPGKSLQSQAHYDEDLEKAREKLRPLIAACKEHGTAIRIGTNMGSVSPRILARYGHTAEALVESTTEFIRIFEDLGFHNTIVSIKASEVFTMVHACHLLASRMLLMDRAYPIHIGVTEAGAGEDGRIKSALGISTLLNLGIGDTIRVSLTEDPEDEIPFAGKILKSTPAQNAAGLPTKTSDDARSSSAQYKVPEFPGCPGSLSKANEAFLGIVKDIALSGLSGDELITKLSSKLGMLLCQCKSAGYCPDIEKAEVTPGTKKILDGMLQACGIRLTKTEIISCPSCARTSFGIQAVLSQVQKEAGHIPGLKIAVMGCVVNGPGEMSGADYGLMGAANGSLWLYKGNKAVQKGLNPDKAVSELKKMIMKDGRWIPVK